VVGVPGAVIKHEAFPEFSQEDSDMAMLNFLLAHGADPNSGLNGQSEWRLILESLMDDRDGQDRRRLKSFEPIKLLLRHGADFEQQCTSQPRLGKSTDAKASELLREWYDADQFGVLEDIVKRRANKTKKSQKISKKMRNLKLWISSKK
jgi:hypothetical protein